MRKQYRLLLQALFVAIGLTVSMSVALYAADENQAQATEAGLVIVAVDGDGPAAAAGITRGDILLAVDGTEVNTIEDLAAALADVEAGITVTLQIQHGDDVSEIEVETGTNDSRAYLGILPYGTPDLAAPTAPDMAMPSAPNMAMPGARLFQRRLEGPGMPPTATLTMPQVMVMDVLTDSAASAAGIEVGDVITAVNEQPLVGPQMLQMQLAELAPGDVITLTIIHAEGEPTDVAVTLGEGEAGQAQLGVRLSMMMHHMAQALSGQSPEMMPFQPGQEPPMGFDQAVPGAGNRRFFGFRQGMPDDNASPTFRFHWVAPPMHFFALPHPGWMGKEEFMKPQENQMLPFPPSQPNFMMMPPLPGQEGMMGPGMMMQPGEMMAPPFQNKEGMMGPEMMMQPGTMMGQGEMMQPGMRMQPDAIMESGVMMKPNVMVESGEVTAPGMMMQPGTMLESSAPPPPASEIFY